jgi:hypothetical protein
LKYIHDTLYYEIMTDSLNELYLKMILVLSRDGHGREVLGSSVDLLAILHLKLAGRDDVVAILDRGGCDLLGQLELEATVVVLGHVEREVVPALAIGEARKCSIVTLDGVVAFHGLCWESDVPTLAVSVETVAVHVSVGRLHPIG